jgi:hypothetical protein
MGRMNHDTKVIHLATGKDIRMFPEDVVKNFNLPHCGRVPWHHTLDKSFKAISSITAKIGVTDDKEACSVVAENFLRRSSNNLNPLDEEAFKIAFIVYVMGILVDVKRPSHWDSFNFLPTLANVHQSKSFDWATCILDDLASMCLEAQCDAKKKLDPCTVVLHPDLRANPNARIHVRKDQVTHMHRLSEYQNTV